MNTERSGVDIKPPYGYTDIAPLTATQRVRPASGAVPDVFRTINAMPLSYSEIPIACRDYPIAFLSGDTERSFLAMAILGLEDKQNLFVDKDGHWDLAAYVPAYVRRYPFCMAKVITDGKERSERLVCVEKSALSDEGDLLYDEEGRELPAWQATKNLLVEFEADLTRTEGMCSIIQRLGLFEPFSVQAVPNRGLPLALTGMHRVAEQKLSELPGDELRRLTQNGVLARVYAQILSQFNFQRLLDRRTGSSGSPQAIGSTMGRGTSRAPEKDRHR